MLNPLFARVLLERPKAEKIGSILMPMDVSKRYATLKCKVVAVGPTADDAIHKLIGKQVLIGRHAGDWLNEDGTPGNPEKNEGEFFIVQDEDILCEVTDD